MQPTEKKAVFPGLIGAGVGALASPEGQRGEGAVHGAGRELGALTGGAAGLATGGLTGAGIGAGLSALAPDKYKSIAFSAPLVLGALGGAGLGGVGGYHAGAGIAKGFTDRKAPWQASAKKKKKKQKPTTDKEATMKNRTTMPATTKSAFDFGKMLGDAGKMVGDAGSYAKNMYNQVPEGMRSGIGMGGLGGAALGGLAGLIAPGEEEQYDAMGNLVGRKQRGRFGAMLRGALGGGVMGAGAGGLAGHLAPDAVNKAYSAASSFGGDLAKRLGFGPKAPTSTANPKSPQEVALAAEQGRGGNYAKSYRGSDKDYFSPSLQKGEAKRFRDAQTASAPGTMGASIASGNTGGQVSNPLYKGPNTANMQTPTSPTYTPTDAAGIAARRAAAAAAEQAKLDRMTEMTMGPSAYAKSKAQQAAAAQQASMDQEAGISNVSPEVLALMKNNPAEFARLMQDAKERGVQENLQSAPNRGFDASGIDMSAMQMPTPATMR